jgi:hypothetical protein
VGETFPHSILDGWDAEHAVENVVFDNLWIQGKKVTSAAEGKFAIENAEGIVFK